MAGQNLSVKGAGSTALRKFAVTDPIAAEIGDLSIDFSDLDVEKAGDSLSINGSAVTALQALKTDLPEQPGQPKITATVDTLKLTLSKLAAAIAAGAPQWQTGIDAEVGGLSAAIGKNLAKAKARQVTLKGATTDQSLSLAADELVISNLQADLSDKLATAFDSGEKKPPAGEPAPAVKLGRLALVNGSEIRYRDTSVEPNVDVTVAANPLELKNVDTGKPNQRTDLKLGGTLNEFAKLDVSGWVEPLAGKPTFDLSANVQGLQLPAFSPYAAEAIGMNLEAGTLSTNAKGAANQGKLNANVKLQLSNLKLSPLSPADAERLSAQVGIPVETAVSLLKDADGTIRLELPISGTTDSPDIDLSQVIGKAIGGAFGSLFASTDTQGGVAFNPIAFKPGSTQLEQGGIAIARDLANMMQKRPQMTVNVCGRATAQDLSAYASRNGLELPKALPPANTGNQAAAAIGPEELEQINADMNKLATERTLAVRRYMTSGLGIGEGRIAECRPVFDQTDTGVPRVEISL
jgi:outer membrane protein OmpA-like peptidoglycan-associated protein